MEGNFDDDYAQTVLLVEDNPDHAELIGRCLDCEQIGARLYHVSDGEAALEFLERKGHFSDPNASPRPVLIFMDLRLPRLDGLSLLRFIKNDSNLRSIPVVVLTTSTAAPDIDGAYSAHANAYLAKSLNFDEFKTHLQAAAKFWLQCNRTPSLALNQE
ncbi:MAG: response regulator [Gammaproteobacteria bacterium]|nr:response regulator [Gammaproteobacteria bacterium]